jgi:GNAT superfamily N-acetyltransferase
MEIRPLTQDDLSAAVELSTQAGWNQLETDWGRLLALCPEGCFGGWSNGELLATSTVLSYEDGPSWIGMVLVNTPHRRRGYGREIFTYALAWAQDRGDPPVGLDSTDIVRPLYLEQAFLDVAPITRWIGPLRRSIVPEHVDLIDREDLRRIVDFDQEASGWRRGDLFAKVLSEPQAFGLAWHPAGEDIRGFTLVRPGRTAWQIGPVVSESAAGLDALLSGAAARLGPVPVLIDLLNDDPAIHQILRSWDLAPRRHLVRMVQGRPSILKPREKVIAATGLELG